MKIGHRNYKFSFGDLHNAFGNTSNVNATVFLDTHTLRDKEQFFLTVFHEIIEAFIIEYIVINASIPENDKEDLCDRLAYAFYDFSEKNGVLPNVIEFIEQFIKFGDKNAEND